MRTTSFPAHPPGRVTSPLCACAPHSVGPAGTHVVPDPESGYRCASTCNQ
jgi:hypothetical protein